MKVWQTKVEYPGKYVVRVSQFYKRKTFAIRYADKYKHYTAAITISEYELSEPKVEIYKETT